ncbi:YacC family pilotin-like protein [Buttiauxella sp. S04-F03]|uniref:YacC family pilotin-like protein n=1 Tax=Buttiauxella sp. W03-F01 TaxID=2904524 RepID=UPI001E4718CD|nr:YacC family pilotin-like protein [Buttiauxella sp. W03-F01]MCE0802112.1 YacC family pilotin-like protein [Buttiauxella sp. W03-F01]
MKMGVRALMLGLLLVFSTSSQALSESEAEDMADLTAVFVFLKNDCGYQNLPNGQIRRALVFFAQQNQWDLSNYDTFNMKALGEDSYRDLSGIAIPTAKKCKSLARDSLSLLAYVK